MRVTALELNDAGMLAVRADGTCFQSPGFALLDERGIVVGRDAERRARLQPRLVNHQFWDQLSTDAIRTPTRLDVSFADLVSLHLESIWQQVSQDTDQLILSVPGCYSTTQLGLLLGISEQLSIPVGGVVESGLAALSASSLSSGCYLDIALHKVTMTAVLPDQKIGQNRYETVEEWGLLTLYEHWQRVIRNEFIRATRFDPLYSAQSEQALFDGLPHWLSDMEERSSTEIGLNGPDGRVHAITLTREQLVSAVRARFQELETLVGGIPLEDESLLPIRLSHRLGALPGLQHALGSSSTDIHVLPPGSAARGALAHADTILSNGPTTFTDRFPGNEPANTVVTSSPTRPTHLLYGGLAYRLKPNAKNALRLVNRDELHVSRADEAQNSFCVLSVTGQHVTVLEQASASVYLNGTSVSKPTRLSVGDILTFEGKLPELKLIAVIDEHET